MCGVCDICRNPGVGNKETEEMIKTERTDLRPFDEGDLAFLNSLYSDPVIMKYMPFDLEDMEASKEHLDRMIRDWKADPVMNHEFVVVERKSGEKIARCHIQIDTDTDTGMIGWLILVDRWNMGYATEITKELIRYSFDELGLHRVNALCNPENIRSRKVLEKFMRLEAHYIQKVRYVKGGATSWEDELEYALLKEEYMKKK